MPEIREAQVNSSGRSLHLVAQGFLPYTTVSMVLHSVPIDLGGLTTSGAGGIDALVRLPATAGAGHHVLLLTGEDAAGRSVTISRRIILGHTTKASRSTQVWIAALLILAIVVAAAGVYRRRRRPTGFMP
jgi:hypothetical protein